MLLTSRGRQFWPESVANLLRNRWPVYCGIGTLVPISQLTLVVSRRLLNFLRAIAPPG